MRSAHQAITSPATLALVLRIVGFHLTSLPEAIESSHILSTPFDGIRNLREGLHTHSLPCSPNPYSSPQFHHHPLYLSLFSTILPLNSSSRTSYILTTSAFIIADWIGARALRGIWRARRRLERRLSRWKALKAQKVTGQASSSGRAGTLMQTGHMSNDAKGEGKEKAPGQATSHVPERSSQGRIWLRDGWEESAMSIFLFNPYTIMTCLARSTRTMENALLLTSIRMACEENHLPLSMFLLAIATHTSIYPVLLLPFLVLLNEQHTASDMISQPSIQSTEMSAPDAGAKIVADARPPASNQGHASRASRLRMTGIQAVSWFAASFVALYAVSEVIMGGMRWEKNVFYDLLAVTDLTPNVGLSWYLFTEMFDHFRPFFVGVFQLHILIYVAPLCLRLHKQPLLATTLMTGIISTLKSYPTLGDASLSIGLLGCFPDLWSSLRHPFVTICVHLYTSILLPLLHDLWLVAGTGNANFFYAATLVYGLGCGMGIVDLLAAGIKNEVGLKALTLVDHEEAGESPQDVLEGQGLHILQFGSLD